MRLARKANGAMGGAVLSAVLLALALGWSGPAGAQKRPRGGGKKAPATQSAPAVESAEPQSGAAELDTGVVAPAPEPTTTTTPAAIPSAAEAAQGVQAPDTSVSTETDTPPAAPETSAEPAPSPAVPAALSKNVAEVMDELVQLRARTRVLGKALFKTKVQVRVDNEAAPDQIAARLQLWLDGAPIWSGDGSGLKDAERVLFEGLAAPGPHVLTYEVEQRARDDEKYRYSQRASLRFVALRDRRMELVLVLEDDSDMAEDFDEDEEGEYDVRVQLQVSAHRLDE